MVRINHYLKYVWSAMKQRCDNPRYKHYANYGGRGISYDPSWRYFANFVRDMGDRPEGLSLDRINNDGNYCKENCRWATAKEQNNNKRPKGPNIPRLVNTWDISAAHYFRQANET